MSTSRSVAAAWLLLAVFSVLVLAVELAASTPATGTGSPAACPSATPPGCSRSPR